MKFFRLNCFFHFFILFCFLITSIAYGKENNATVIISKGQSIRDLAKTWLNDPDLWMDILRANNLESAHEVRPGMKLMIPVKMILRTRAALDQSGVAIGKATSAGARIFAVEDISSAIANRNKALDERKSGQWKNAVKLAEMSRIEAQKALKKSLKNRDVPAQAVLTGRKGKVQRRKSSDLYWVKLPVNSVLAEQEKIRTLSESYAEILFRDNSRIRLNANSQVAIRKMRTDRLKKQETSSVVLSGGDIYALLKGSRKKNKFDLKLTGIDTKIESNNFWIDQKGKDTKFANYDGELAVTSNGETVVLKKNQGTLVKQNRKPSFPINLIPSPRPVSPQNFTTIYSNEKKSSKIELQWTANDKAALYWVEIASEKTFRNLVVNEKKIDQNTFSFFIAEEGIYYWRVAAIDREGFPGPKSKSIFFKLQKDTKAPYLILTQPEKGSVIKENPVKISGKTEAEATLMHEGKQVEVNRKGEFSFECQLKPGSNTILVKAKDPAGNVTNLDVNLEFLPDKSFLIAYDADLKRIKDNHFVTNRPDFTLTGLTKPGVKIGIEPVDSAFKLKSSAFSDDSGRFQVNIPVNKSAKKEFILKASLSTGVTVEDRFIIESDTTTPLIEPAVIKKSRVNKTPIHLKGKVTGASRLFLNEKDVRFGEGGLFELDIDLVPGKNMIKLMAEDIAGNQAVWEKTINLDMKPPVFEKLSLSKKYSKGNEQIFVKVTVSDESGLKAGVRFALQAGEYIHKGYLRLCPSKKCYSGDIFLPAHAKGNIKFLYIKLQDYLGNMKEYNF